MIRARVALLVAGSLLLFTPYAASAFGTAADAMCAGDECPVGLGPTGKCDKAGAGTIGKACSDPGSGVTGVCVHAIPPQCQATNAPGQKGGNALDQGLSKLGEILGQLMQQLMKGGGGGGGDSGSGTGTNPNGTCTTLQPTSDQNLAMSNPSCYYYQPIDLGGGVTDPSGGLVATPTNGPTPLTVYFGYQNGTAGCHTPALTLDFGDGTAEQAPTHSETTCSSPSEQTQHTYTGVGSYQARLKNASTGEVKGGVNLTVNATSTNGGGGATTTVDNPQPNPTEASYTGGTNTGGTNTGGTNTAGSNTGGTGGNNTNISGSIFTTPLDNLNGNGTGGTSTGGSNSTGTGGSGSTGGSASTGGSNSTGTGTGAALNFNTPQSIVQSIIAKNLPPGAYGDVKILSNGTTIVANSRDSNSEVAGFFGSDSTIGAGQSTAARLCQNRPWARNFLSFVIPPSFFDSICTWRGYVVGAPAVTPGSSTGGQTTPRTTTTTTVGGTQQRPATQASSTVNAPVPRVDIWASPESVPLDARTSIFWNTENVKDCIETSPDGSFSHNTLKGGASTVPLTAATTFTISCTAPNGSHITDNVTVQISL